MSGLKEQTQTLVAELKKAKAELVESKKIMDKKDKHSYPITPPLDTPGYYEWLYLSDASVIQEGPGIRKHQYADSGVQFLTVTNILEGSIDFEKSQKYIAEDEYESKYKHFTINNGDIVTACSGATWGKSAMFDIDYHMMLNTSTLRLRFYNDLCNNKFLYYYTKTDFFKKNLSSHSTGQQANYGYSHYSKIPIPIPPLEEQKQIVALLDKAFEAIDKAKANIEQNIINARELFDSFRNSFFDNLKDKGTGVYNIEKVCEKIFAGGDVPKDNMSKTPTSEYSIPIYANAVKEDGLYGYTDKARVLKPSVTVAARGSGTGHTLVRKEPFLPIVRLICLVPNEELITEDYLMHAVQCLDIMRSGSAIPQLTVPMMKGYDIPVPKLEEQNIYTALFTEVLEKSKSLNDSYNQKLESLEELKKSILQKAFNGELTRGEANVKELVNEPLGMVAEEQAEYKKG